ncbi:MAG: FtsX-like permease family protein [Verrucomicrobia bacterium]|nr:FtsX-like permease family protein [Verrucomicrobiota bacterium]
MTLFHIVLRSLRQHALSTGITAASIALAGGLLMSVWIVKEQSQKAFTGVNAGFDAVLGARGAKLQLVLNAVFHLEESPGNLAWQDFLDIQKSPAVLLAVPIAVGDNYHGYRLVGTTTNLFTEVEYLPGKRYRVTAPGRPFEAGYTEAVVGSFVAQRLGLKVGDEFHPFHGLIFDEKNQHAETYVVTGIMEPSNTPADRVIWIPLEGIQNMKGHDAKSAADISAVLIKLKSQIAGRTLELLYNKQGNRLTFAWPIAQIMAQLFDKIAWFDRVLALVSYLVALVATASVLASIYNSMNERRRDIAILRALGARRHTIFCTVVLEAAAIAALGMVAAFVIYGGILSVVAKVIRAQTGVVLDPFAVHPILLWTPLAMIGMSALAGIVPAIKAYRTNVAENLTPVS